MDPRIPFEPDPRSKSEQIAERRRRESQSIPFVLIALVVCIIVAWGVLLALFWDGAMIPL